MSLVQITHQIIINTNHIISIDAVGNIDAEKPVVYNITMIGGKIYQLKMPHDYYVAHAPFAVLRYQNPALFKEL